ncbi:MAG: tryptophan synthase subunit alpha [Actinomycetota bacterium]
MNRIDKTFEALKKEGHAALITYIMAGYPRGLDSAKTITAIADAGADLIEVGIPFSDPLADGATIQKASEESLAGGMTPNKALAAVAEARKVTQTPILVMTYYNIIFRYGLEPFAEAAAAAGVDGAIVPDLPPEEAGKWQTAAGAQGLGTVFLVAPTSSPARIRGAAEASDGFVYCVSLAGVTGGRAKLAPGLPAFIETVKQTTDKPVAVGFGVSTAAQAAELSRLADGVIVGSALIDRLAAGGAEGVASAAGFISELKAEMR